MLELASRENTRLSRSPLAQRLAAHLSSSASCSDLASSGARHSGRARVGLALDGLVQSGLSQLPLPGSGRTLERWSALAEVAAHDLSLAKLFEGHADALAILAELGAPAPAPGSTWGTWCAETGAARMRCTSANSAGQVQLRGRKAWCSGAASLSHALVTVWDDSSLPWLAAVDLRQPGVTVTTEGWEAVGMEATGSVDVVFDGALATRIGSSGAYFSRSGFWHGGAGVACCWFGAATALGCTLQQSCRTRVDSHKLAALGRVDMALNTCAALIRESAAWIDRHPTSDARVMALRLRLVAESCATEVLQQATRALGATPVCRDAGFARLFADLPVFLRQSHAERDLEALGLSAAESPTCSWTL